MGCSIFIPVKQHLIKSRTVPRTARLLAVSLDTLSDQERAGLSDRLRDSLVRKLGDAPTLLRSPLLPRGLSENSSQAPPRPKYTGMQIVYEAVLSDTAA
jgi:hypothetical protein